MGRSIAVLVDLLARVGWSGTELARRLGVGLSTVYAWQRGINSRGNPSQPPERVLAWLERVAKAIEKVQP